MFEHVDNYKSDPVLTLNKAFKKDQRKDKLNLTIGLYYDEAGIVPQINAIAEAKRQLNESGEMVLDYLPSFGLTTYRSLVGALIFGSDNPLLRRDQLATVQSLGSTGGLRIGAEFLKRYFPQSEIWMSNPTWDTHYMLFNSCGFRIHYYPYYDAVTRGVLFDDMCATLNQLPPKSIVLFHSCCHNPTGNDLTNQQWDQIIPILKDRDVIPFLDMAYQGLSEGLDADCYAIRKMASMGLPCLVSNSFSKIFSLYEERVGGLSIVCNDQNEKEHILSQLESLIYYRYISPSFYGARHVEIVLNDPVLKACWANELSQMRQRLKNVRKDLFSALRQRIPDYDFSYLLTQKGFFNYTGLSKQQILLLRQQCGIYLLDNGRLSIPAVNKSNIDRITDAMTAVIKKRCFS